MTNVIKDVDRKAIIEEFRLLIVDYLFKNNDLVKENTLPVVDALSKNSVLLALYNIIDDIDMYLINKYTKAIKSNEYHKQEKS